MEIRSVLSILAMSWIVGTMAFAQAVPDVKLVPSPPGQAAVQLGGRWEKTAEGGQAYRDGKWVVVNYGRPLLRGRTNIFGSGEDYGRTVNAGAPLWRAGANDTTRLITQAPLTMRAAKEVVRRLRERGAGIEDKDLIALCYGSADFQEGLDAFLAKRPPRFTGR